MTKKKEIIKKYVELIKGLNRDDPEMAHVDADSFLLEALIDLGAEEIADAFQCASDHIGFWYA